VQTRVALTLYICGNTARAQRAAAVARSLPDCDLLIIDVMEHPEIAEREHILATPTLVRHDPPPPRRLVGDLSELATVRRSLGLPI